MNIIHNLNLTPYSQKLRREMTPEERKLWYNFLKGIPLTVHRQKVIENYIVDFYIAQAKIIIELDGSQHYDDKAARLDEIRNKRLKELGYTVLRYTNLDIIRRFKEVCMDIENHLEGLL